MNTDLQHFDINMSPATSPPRPFYLNQEDIQYTASFALNQHQNSAAVGLQALSQPLGITQPPRVPWNSHYGGQPDTQSALEATSWDNNIYNTRSPMNDTSTQSVSDQETAPDHRVLQTDLLESEPPRKKKKRAAQACMLCRKKKAKCNEGRPTCRQCFEADVECVYAENNKAAKKEDSSDIYKHILELLNSYQFSLTRSTEEVVHDVVDYVQQYIQKEVAPVKKCLAYMVMLFREKGAFTDAESDWLCQFPAITEGATPAGASDSNDCNNSGKCRASFSQTPESVLSTCIRQSVSTHSLVDTWPAIQGFYRGITDPTFLMKYELSKASLNSATQASFQTKNDLYQALGVISKSSHSSDSDDSLLNVINTDVQANSPAMSMKYSFQNPGTTFKNGWDKAHELWISYKKHVHVSHPFLNVGVVEQIINRLGHCKADLSPNPPQQRGNGPVKTEHYHTVQPSLSRKRKYADDVMFEGSSALPSQRPNVTERSIESATLLLVLALGELCQHSIVRTSKFRENGVGISDYHGVTNNCTLTYPSKLPISFKTLREAGFNVYDPVEKGLPRTHVETQGSSYSTTSSMQSIPGLNYYCCALEILGGVHYSSNLEFIHAKILIALYASQLMRPMEAWTSISEAANLIEATIKRNPRVKDAGCRNPTEESIRVTYWVILQLESDFCTQLEWCTPSGVSELESIVPIPLSSSLVADCFSPWDEDMWLPSHCFVHELSLWKILSENHSILGHIATEPLSDLNMTKSLSKIEELRVKLDKWKEIFLKGSPCISWGDGFRNPPSNVHVARLWAKFYAAQAMIHLPFLKYVLESGKDSLPFGNISFTSDTSGTSSSVTCETISTKDALNDAAISCVDALKHSTAAFDGLGYAGRDNVVPNLFGTTQIKFGNILLLGAVLKLNTWRIEREDFDSLLQRTLDFFNDLAPLSSTIRTEIHILQEIKRQCKDKS